MITVDRQRGEVARLTADFIYETVASRVARSDRVAAE
jgi:hypothetical protein